MLDRVAVAHTRLNVAEIREAINGERLTEHKGAVNPIAHQIGHAAKAVGARLIKLGEAWDRHDEHIDTAPLGQPGLANQ